MKPSYKSSYTITGGVVGTPVYEKDALVSFPVLRKILFKGRAIDMWDQCMCYGDVAEDIAPFIAKGKTISIWGEIYYNKKKNFKAEVHVNRFEIY